MSVFFPYLPNFNLAKASEASLFLKGHTAPIKSLSSFTNTTNSHEMTMVSASQDQTLKIWNVCYDIFELYLHSNTPKI